MMPFGSAGGSQLKCTPLLPTISHVSWRGAVAPASPSSTQQNRKRNDRKQTQTHNLTSNKSAWLAGSYLMAFSTYFTMAQICYHGASRSHSAVGEPLVGYIVH